MANVITNEDDADNGMKLGMIIGGSYAMELADAMNLDISLAFKQSGTKSTNDFTGGSNTITWSLNYLDISPSIAYSVSDQFALLFGPYLSFAMSGKLKIKTEITNLPTEESEQDI